MISLQIDEDEERAAALAALYAEKAKPALVGFGSFKAAVLIEDEGGLYARLFLSGRLRIWTADDNEEAEEEAARRLLRQIAAVLYEEKA